MEGPVNTWREKRGGMVLIKDVNESEDGGDRKGAEPAREDVEIEVCGDEDWAGGVFVINVNCN